MPVREQQERGDHHESDGQRQQLIPGEQGKRVADQADERKGADAAEGVGVGGCLVLLALKSDQERQEQDQTNLYQVRRQLLENVH